MMRRNQLAVSITEEQRNELDKWAQLRTLPAGDVFRARLILALADGQSYRQIMDTLQTTAPIISRWKQRFEEQGIAGVDPLHKGSPTPRSQRGDAGQDRPQDTAEADRWIHALVVPQDGPGIGLEQVHRAARMGANTVETAPVGPLHSFQRSELRTESRRHHCPLSESTATRCGVRVDEKTAIQALDRLDPVLPLSPGRAERHGFEYYRHCTLSLYAALDVKTGKVHGMTAARHTSLEFIAFLEGLVERTGWAEEIHVVLDNLSAHKTKDVERFLAEHPQVRFHFTPTYSSWLNQSGIVVRQDPARRHRPGRVSLGCRSWQPAT